MMENRPSFNLNSESILDLTVENPDIRSIFSTKDVEQNYFFDVQTQKEDDGTHQVVLLSKIQFSKDEKKLFVLEMAYSGIFSLTDVPEDYANWILFVECPHFLFPTPRHLIITLMQRSGFTQFDLPNINFAALLEEKMRQAKEQEAPSKLIF